MKNSFIRNLKIFFKEPQWEKVRGLFWFMVIILIVHIIWRIWAGTFYFAPIQSFIAVIRTFLVKQVSTQTLFVLDVLNIKVTSYGTNILTNNNIYLIIGQSAAGLKQIFQFFILIMLFHGPWKHKFWFIPAGILILHLTNVFRILCLVVIAMHWPNQIHYAHDNYLRILYYIVIFGLWIVWVEKISPLNHKKKVR